MVTLPSHTSNRLQPFDVAVHGPLNTYLSQQMDKYKTNHPGERITDYTLGPTIRDAYIRSINPTKLREISGSCECARHQTLQVCQQAAVASVFDDSGPGSSRHSHGSRPGFPLAGPHQLGSEVHRLSHETSLRRSTKRVACRPVLRPARGGRIPRRSTRILEWLPASTQSVPAGASGERTHRFPPGEGQARVTSKVRAPTQVGDPGQPEPTLIFMTYISVVSQIIYTIKSIVLLIRGPPAKYDIGIIRWFWCPVGQSNEQLL
jgi:hypothetical protein